MADTMRALVWDGGVYPQGLELRVFPKPAPEPGWVVINTKAAGICGSDLHYMLGYTRQLISVRNLPSVLGHENECTFVGLPGPVLQQELLPRQ